MRIDKHLVSVFAALAHGAEVSFVWSDERDPEARGWYVCVGDVRARIPDDGVTDPHAVRTVEVFVRVVNAFLAAFDHGTLAFVALYEVGGLEEPHAKATREMNREGRYDDWSRGS
ncbi:MAG: hypothetical protein EBT21_01305, partial [Actinobacteria bacterium]|nr:hypothetical protein [Actinomycetota bacterium]